MRLDLHVHTCYSYDSALSLDRLSAAVRRKGLDGVAVLDHDEIEGALRLRERAPFKVIVGEEIGTEHGGIGALFIERRIPPLLTAEETIAQIHEQNGLVFVPHPLARAVLGRIEESKLHQIADQIDLIEGYNARAPLSMDDMRARAFADQHGLPVAAGSDGHFAYEIGRAWTEMDDFRTSLEFVDSLRRARLHYTTKTPYLVPLLTVLVMIPALAARRKLTSLWRSVSRPSA